MPKDKKRSRDDDEDDQEVVQLALELSSVQQGSKGLDVKLKVRDPQILTHLWSLLHNVCLLHAGFRKSATMY